MRVPVILPILMRHAQLLFLFLPIPAPAFPGTVTEAALLGFSPDGKYLSYREFGVTEGSGESCTASVAGTRQC